MAFLDKIIHERARLLIVTHLAANRKREVSFTELQDALGLTSGNLSIQLKKLNAAGYATISKRFKDNKPHTTASITPKGADALQMYVDEMESILKLSRK